MLVPSPNAPASPSMLLVYAITIVVVFLCSTPAGDVVVRHVIPLQQYQRPQQRSIVTEFTRSASESQTAPKAERPGDGNHEHHNKAGNEKAWIEEEEARRLVERQRTRALRHADYMRIETLHFLKLVAASIPSLRAVWRGDDFCAWEGVSCTALHVPLEALIDMPSIMVGSHMKAKGSSSSSGKDGLQLLIDGDDNHNLNPIFTFVGLRLRGMNLFGHLPMLRPVGASRESTPQQPAVLVKALMEKRYSRERREEDRRRLIITSPREPQYWPWDVPDMHLHASLQNSTYEMVRYTLRRILRRLEEQGMRNNHSDVQGLGSLSSADYVSGARAGCGGTSSTVQSAKEGAGAGFGTVSHDTLLIQLTRQDVAETVFGEIEPRLVAIQRLDISQNPGVLITQPSEWQFPYMRIFNIAGTSVRHFKPNEKWAKAMSEGLH